MAMDGYVRTMLMESPEPNDFPQLGHLRERFEIRSLTQEEQKTWPQSLMTVLRMFDVQTGQIASCCEQMLVEIQSHMIL